MSADPGAEALARADEALRKVLATAGEAVRTATDERDALIVEMVAAGLSQREVARAVGLSHTAVQQILRREAAAS